MNLTHCLIAFVLGFGGAFVCWIGSFRRLRRRYTGVLGDSLKVAEENYKLRVNNQKLEAALIRAHATIRKWENVPSLVEALVVKRWN